MFSLPIGRRNANSSERGYAMIPVDRNNGVSGSDENNDQYDSLADRVRSRQEDDDNRDNQPPTDAEGDGEANQQRRTFNLSTAEQEQIRRQQILRLGLIACLVLFLMDDSSYTSVNNKPGSHSGNNNSSSKHIEQSPDEVRFSTRDLNDARTVLLPIRPVNFVKRNATGMFKGSWQSYSSPSLANAPATKAVIQHSQEFRSYLQSPNNTFRMEDGSLIMTLKTVPIRDLPDLSFIYGIARTYNSKLKLVNEMSFPMQGVLLASEKKVLLFSTPYKSQKLMMQFSETKASTLSSSVPSAAPTIVPSTETAPVENRLLIINTNKDNNHDKEVNSPTHELITTQSEGISFRIRPPTTSTTDNNGHNDNDVPTTAPTRVSPTLEMKIFVWDSAIAPFNTTHWTNNDTRTMSLGDFQLSTRFHMYQMTRPTMLYPKPSFLRGAQSNSNTNQLPTVSRKTEEDSSSSAASPSINHIQTPASLGSDCFYALELELADSTVGMAQLNQQVAEEDPISQLRYLKEVDSVVNDVENVDGLADHQEIDNNEATEHRRLSSIIPSTDNLHGAVKGFFSCAKTFIVSVASYQVEYDGLKSKVEIYSLLYTAISLFQVVFVIYQIRFSSTQALSSRLSISSVLAQSVLDAVICMGHLLLGTGVSDLFFTSFIWISIIKLLLFSVFQMRLVINAYQARFAQEISLEGMRGLRARLVTMHIRFYGVVLFILIVGFTFPIHPVIVVTVLYSFWIPQIVHSVQHGTKHSLHPVYLYGISVTRLFLPLYIMGCPENFLVGLWEYFSPSDRLPPNSMILSTFACYFLVLWVAAQVLVLYMQSVFGPRFFIPKRFLPQRYDYHRPLPTAIRINLGLVPAPTTSASTNGNSSNHDNTSSNSVLEDGDLETGALLRAHSGTHRSSSGLEMTSLTMLPRDEPSSPTHLHHHHHNAATSPTSGAAAASSSSPASTGLECVICYNAIEIQGYNTNYMITPCDHVFHGECLQQWLRVKLECPVCRSRCPPSVEDGDSA